MAGIDGRKPWDDYRQLLRELELYDASLLTKERLVVANKMDEPAAAANLKSFKRRIRRTRVLEIAAALDQGIRELKACMREAVEVAGAWAAASQCAKA
jgi:GTP-binding protein